MYDFVNAQEMHRKNPRTFEVPSAFELSQIKVGGFVKVCHNEERFWVEVVALDGETITGTVGNQLVCEQPFEYGDRISFKRENVYCIY